MQLSSNASPVVGPGAGSVRRSVLTDLVEIAHDLVAYKDLLYQLTRRDVRIRYKQAVMGFAWAILMPVLIVFAGVLVRLALATAAGTTLDRPAIAALLIKALPWAFFVGSLQFASASLTGNTSLVGKIYFPREVLPLSATLAQGFDSLIGAAAVALMFPFLDVPLQAQALWMLLLLPLLLALTIATNLFISCANLFFRDVKYIVQVLVTFGIFFTPVLFDVSMLGPNTVTIVMLNPLAPILEGMRLAVVEGHNLIEPLTVVTRSGASVLAWSPWYLAYSAAWATLGLAGSAVFFHRLEFLFAEYV